MNPPTHQWAIVGAGPAGIAAVGKLLDYGIDPKQILWIDPHFTVGDLGRLWQNVSSNTTVKLFLNFLESTHAFSYYKAPADFHINHLPPHETCTLQHIVEPLQWISEQLKTSVLAKQTFIHEMKLSERVWSLRGDSKTYYAKNVILATGALPETLNYPGIDVVPFDLAIDKERLAAYVNTDDTYAVFGASHSAIIILNYLVDLGVKSVINFYRSPCRYAINMGDWTLFDNTGLKGHTAAWARQHIDGTRPNNLTRHTVSEANLARYLPACNKAIYAVGFKRRNNILIDNYEHADYNPHVGIIGPGLFGLGIGYPELKTDPFGCKEYQVGLWKFMTYLNRVMPVWLKYPS